MDFKGGAGFSHILGLIIILIGALGIVGYLGINFLGLTLALNNLMLLFLSETAALIFWILIVILGLSLSGLKLFKKKS